MPDLVAGLGKVPADRLPGDRPVFAGLVIAYVDIMPGSVERDSILPETCDAMVLGGLVEGVTTTHCARGLHTGP